MPLIASLGGLYQHVINIFFELLLSILTVTHLFPPSETEIYFFILNF